jgi:hypothetical protein
MGEIGKMRATDNQSISQTVIAEKPTMSLVPWFALLRRECDFSTGKGQ